MNEEMLISFCSPTLAGLKTGNIFNCTRENFADLKRDIRSYNKRFSKKGIRILPLKTQEKSSLIYVYRPAKLKKDFLDEKVSSLLESKGYNSKNPSECVAKLIKNLKPHNEFPHEIGLFLGYPPEDVKGFIENRGENAKATGCWKVYHDREGAEKLWEKYRKCSKIYKDRFHGGYTLEKLTIMSR